MAHIFCIHLINIIYKSIYFLNMNRIITIELIFLNIHNPNSSVLIYFCTSSREFYKKYTLLPFLFHFLHIFFSFSSFMKGGSLIIIGSCWIGSTQLASLKKKKNSHKNWNHVHPDCISCHVFTCSLAYFHLFKNIFLKLN